MPFLFKSASFCLRYYEEKDIPHLATYLDNWNIARWMSRIPHPYTMEMARDWFGQCIKQYHEERPEFFVMADGATDALLGGIGLHEPHACRPAPAMKEIGYWLAEPFWRRGLTSLAAKALIRWGFETQRDLQKVAAVTDPENRASQGVLRKAGLVFMGLVPAERRTALRGGPTVTYWEQTRSAYDACCAREQRTDS